MSKPYLNDALSHWQKPIDGFQTSALDFYAAVEVALKEREIPGIKTSHVKFKESGAASAERIYLRVKRKDVLFDIGAAPFGSGYFFSWWMAQQRPSAVLGILLVISLVITIPWLGSWAIAIILYGMFKLGIVRLLGPLRYATPPLIDRVWHYTWLQYFAMVLLLMLTRRIGRLLMDFDGLLSAVPILGRIYKWAFARDTYYSVDTMLMYQSFVSGVVTEVIDNLTAAKGLRALNEDEKKPIMRSFLKKGESRRWTASA